MSKELISVSRLHKYFYQGGRELHILKGLDLKVNEGEDLCIVGASGAGKSTLLHILGTLDRPTSGHVSYRGEELFFKTDEELSHFRNQTMGFVFQFHHLLSEFTAVENAEMPGRIKGLTKAQAHKRAVELLDQLGLGHRLGHYPSELSGGEQQRVAVARALFCQPEVLLADEPTGNLDTENSLWIQNLFFQLKEEFGLTLIFVTHDQSLSQSFSRTLCLKDGQWVDAPSI